MALLSLEQKQKQSQVMSQRQIQSLKILAMSSDDLRERIYKEVQENPALELTQEQTASYSFNAGTHTTSHSSLAAQEASDRFQAALEAQVDERISLQEHLLDQFTVLPLSASELALGKTLILNLDEKGFHILSPLSLLDKKDKGQTPAVLAHCLSVLQSLDPAGTCTANTQESLLVQAKQKERAPRLALFFLNGHLDFLDPPQLSRIVKKLTDYKKEQAALFASKEDPYLKDTPLTEEAIEQALTFIRTLDPFPARNFSTQDTHYIAPDVVVEKNLEINLAHDRMPGIRINQEMLDLYEKAQNTNGKQMKTIGENIKNARNFIQTVEYRESTLLAAAKIIVQKQKFFFEKGPGNLVPLRQQDVADILKVHETTISRMANSKYLQCEWGLFELKYFFTGSASRSKTENTVSRDQVLHQIKQILIQHEKDGTPKKMSDQQLAEALGKQGIHIARRTVAKYRSLLNISSSYER